MLRDRAGEIGPHGEAVAQEDHLQLKTLSMVHRHLILSSVAESWAIFLRKPGCQDRQAATGDLDMESRAIPEGVVVEVEGRVVQRQRIRAVAQEGETTRDVFQEA